MRLYYIYILLFFFLSSLGYAKKELAPWVGVDFNGLSCDGYRMEYGPYDYSKSENRGSRLHIVEEYHFGKEVQSLRKPPTTGTVFGGITYTLTAFPNHYKALNALIHYKIIFQKDIEKGRKKPVNPSVECFFYRAINFVPKDARVRILFATYLKKIKKYKLANDYYLQGIKIEPDNLMYRYNYALFLLRLKKYKEALEQANYLYSKGFSKQKLKEKLNRLGYEIDNSA